MEYGEPPSEKSLWVYKSESGGVITGVFFGVDVEHINTCHHAKKSLFDVKFLSDLIETIQEHVQNGRLVCINRTKRNEHILLSMCFLKRTFGIGMEEALRRIKSADFKRGNIFGTELHPLQKALFKTYRPPLRIIVSGDRESTSAFKPVITSVLKNLPRHSTVIHGDCRGIDKMSGEIADKLGLKVIVYPITQNEWDTFGLSAGPMRNRKMLEENPDEVHAFHPDISFSKGTKNMVIEAYSRRIPVYIYDLKDKMKYNGSFEEM